MKSREDQVAEILQEQHIQYQRQIPIGRYSVDFYCQEKKLILEMYGCYWHGCQRCHPNNVFIDDPVTGMHQSIEKIVKKDEQRKNVLLSKGYTVFIVWEHELYSQESIHLWMNKFLALYNLHSKK